MVLAVQLATIKAMAVRLAPQATPAPTETTTDTKTKPVIRIPTAFLKAAIVTTTAISPIQAREKIAVTSAKTMIATVSRLQETVHVSPLALTRITMATHLQPVTVIDARAGIAMIRTQPSIRVSQNDAATEKMTTVREATPRAS
jgi:hypothetical protein